MGASGVGGSGDNHAHGSSWGICMPMTNNPLTSWPRGPHSLTFDPACPRTQSRDFGKHGLQHVEHSSTTIDTTRIHSGPVSAQKGTWRALEAGPGWVSLEQGYSAPPTTFPEASVLALSQRSLSYTEAFVQPMPPGCLKLCHN